MLRESKLPDATPGYGTVGAGMAKTTSTARQRNMNPATFQKFFDLCAAAVDEHPHLEENGGYILSIDESQILLSGEKCVPTQKVHYDRTIKQWSFGAARTRAAGAGSNRISLIQTISGDGHVYNPGFYVSGSNV